MRCVWRANPVAYLRQAPDLSADGRNPHLNGIRRRASLGSSATVDAIASGEANQYIDEPSP